MSEVDELRNAVAYSAIRVALKNRQAAGCTCQPPARVTGWDTDLVTPHVELDHTEECAAVRAREGAGPRAEDISTPDRELKILQDMLVRALRQPS